MNMRTSKPILLTLCLALGGLGANLDTYAGEHGGGVVRNPTKPGGGTKPGSGPKHAANAACQTSLCTNENVIAESKSQASARNGSDQGGADESNQRKKSEANNIGTKSSETLTNKDAKQLAKDVNKAVSEGQSNNIHK